MALLTNTAGLMCHMLLQQQPMLCRRGVVTCMMGRHRSHMTVRTPLATLACPQLLWWSGVIWGHPSSHPGLLHAAHPTVLSESEADFQPISSHSKTMLLACSCSRLATRLGCYSCRVLPVALLCFSQLSIRISRLYRLVLCYHPRSVNITVSLVHDCPSLRLCTLSLACLCTRAGLPAHSRTTTVFNHKSHASKEPSTFQVSRPHCQEEDDQRCTARQNSRPLHPFDAYRKYVLKTYAQSPESTRRGDTRAVSKQF